MKILVVEDDPVSSLVLQRVLTRLGHQVDSVPNGALALALLSAGQYGLIVSDWMMPEMDGLELCRRLRAAQACESGLSYTYFILLTSRHTLAERKEALLAGVDDFLIKSLDPDELFARLTVAERIIKLQDKLQRRAEHLIERQVELTHENMGLSERVTADSLTGLKNHGAFYDVLERSFDFARRHSLPLSLLLLDVDYFKQYNDEHGHVAGDEVLRGVARSLSRRIRSQDVAARYGGEEFALILPMVGGAAAFAIADRLRAQLRDDLVHCGRVTASFGAASLEAGASCAEELVAQADEAMYNSKRSGRDCCSLHTPGGKIVLFRTELADAA